MRYADITQCDLNNGDGVRISLWTTGCPHHCINCHNEELWEHSTGKIFTEDTLHKLVQLVGDEYVDGLSILGGEPLAPYNIDGVLKVCKVMKEKYPDKDIWLWTGYTLDNFKNREELFKDIDVIVDGKYEESLPTKKNWRGSDNQKMFKNTNGKFTLVD